MAQHVDAGKAPAAWIAYARAVSMVVQGRLEGDDPAASRLRAYLQQIPGANGAEGMVVKVALWIDKSGRITRIEHAVFAQNQPNEDLDTLVVGQVLPETPPKGILLPLRLSIQIKPLLPDDRPADAKATVTPISARYRYTAEPSR